ncbi:MAG: hypothetical protein WCE68_00305 [Anaerolineales bacterium]
MSRMTQAKYDDLHRRIAALIEKEGSVPPTRELADIFQCSAMTAWRIVRSLGWEAKGHRWIEMAQKSDRIAG